MTFAGISMVKFPSVSVAASMELKTGDVRLQNHTPVRTRRSVSTVASATGNPANVSALPFITAGCERSAGGVTEVTSAEKVGSL